MVILGLIVTPLLEQLKKIDVSDGTFAFFQSYLTGGRQCVSWNGKKSDFVPVSSCCRQGSILGPLLFLLASTDVPNTLAMASAYADDTTGAADNVEIAQQEVKELERVSASVGLTLNGSKTTMMILGGNSGRYSDLSLLVDGETVQHSDTLDILGFRIDHRLDTSVYLDRLLPELKKSLGVLRMLKFRVTRPELRDFAHGILMGKLATYIANCLVVRLTPDEPVCGRGAALQVVVNDLARLLTGHRRKDHVQVSELLSKADIPSVNQIIARDALTMMWTALVAGNGPLVRVLSDLQPASNTRASNSGKLNSPVGSNAIICSGYKLWNEHHVNLRSIKSRAALKTYITKEVWKTLPI